MPTKGEGEEEENSRIIETRSKENISREKTMRAKNRKDNNRMMKDNTDESILIHRGEGRNQRDDKQKVIEFIETNKGIIAEEYVKQSKDDFEIPHCINLITEYFQ